MGYMRLGSTAPEVSAVTLTQDMHPTKLQLNPTTTISVVIINHNYARFLREAIDSTLEQTAHGIQVIVIDDGSTDASREIIAEYGNKIHSILKSEGGHVSAFNIGAAESQGEAILFLDADDKLYPNCIDEVQTVWRRGLSKVQFQLDTIDDQGVDQSMPFPYFPPDLDARRVLQQALRHGTYPWTVSSGVAFAGDFIREITPIDDTIVFKSPDGFANKLAPLWGEVMTLRRVLGAYRVHDSNLWAQSVDEFKVEPLLRNVRLDLATHEHFRKVAAEKGFSVPPLDRALIPPQWEPRLLSFRLARERHPIASDNRWSLLASALRSTLSAPNTSPAGRLMWIAWFLCIAFGPRRRIAQIFRIFRSQAGRPATSRLLMRLAKGTAGAGA
jgi:glycosyltransferase involved in cell wall biosynthesis